MLMRIVSELMLFGMTVVWGVCFNAAYTLIKIFRQYVKHNAICVGIEDFIYCVVTGVILFKSIFDSNDGIIRWYILFGTALGMWIHYKTIGRLFVGISQRFADKIRSFAGKTAKKCRRIFGLLASKALKKKSQ